MEDNGLCFGSADTLFTQNKMEYSSEDLEIHGKENKIMVAGAFTALKGTHNAVTALCEVIPDNILDASATEGHIVTQENNTVLIKDNGCGMTLMKLNSAVTLFNQSDATTYKNGCKGQGFAAAMSFFKADYVVIYSQAKNEMDLLELNVIYVNFKKAIATNIYCPKARPANFEEVDFFNLNAINSEESGTIISLTLNNESHEKLIYAIECNELSVDKSFKFACATKYAADMRRGFNIVIKREEKTTRLHDPLILQPIDLHNVTSMYKQQTVLHIHPATTLPDGSRQSACAYFVDPQTKKLTYFDSNNDVKNTYKKITKNEALQPSKSQIVLNLNYCKVLDRFKQHVDSILHNGLSLLDLCSLNSLWTADPSVSLKRNERVIGGIIAFTEMNRADKRNQAGRSIKLDSRMEIQYSASNYLDELLGISGNKSSCINTNIPEYLKETICRIHEQFAKMVTTQVNPKPVQHNVDEALGGNGGEEQASGGGGGEEQASGGNGGEEQDSVGGGGETKKRKFDESANADCESGGPRKAARKAEAERKAARKAEADRKASADRKAARKASADRKAARKADAERKAEAKRKAARKAEAARKASAERKAARKADAERKAARKAEAESNAAPPLNASSAGKLNEKITEEFENPSCLQLALKRVVDQFDIKHVDDYTVVVLKEKKSYITINTVAPKEFALFLKTTLENIGCEKFTLFVNSIQGAMDQAMATIS